MIQKLGLVLFAALLGSVPAGAQDKFPSRTIEVVTHASTGGSANVNAQMMIASAREVLGADMIMVNRQGGGGAVAHDYLKAKEADGHTILTLTASQLVTIARGDSVFKTTDDLIPIARGTDDPLYVMVSGASPWKTLDDLKKAHAEKQLRYGITSVGGNDHITTWQFAEKLGVKQPIVIPLSSSEQITTLVGGTTDATLTTFGPAASQIRSGEIRPLAVFAPERLKHSPDIPTARELGVDLVSSSFRGWVVLKGTPEDRVAVLREGLMKAMQSPEYQDYLKNSGLTPDSAADHTIWGEQMKTEHDAAAVAIKALGLAK